MIDVRLKERGAGVTEKLPIGELAYLKKVIKCPQTTFPDTVNGLLMASTFILV